MDNIKHGNNAKITKKIEPLYQTLTNEPVLKNKDRIPLVNDENVILSKKFVDENHK